MKGDYRVQDDYGASDRPFVHISKTIFPLIKHKLFRGFVYVTRLPHPRGFSTNDWVINEVEVLNRLYCHFVNKEICKSTTGTF